MLDNKSLLLVEDDKYIAMALQIRLVAQQYDVALASGFGEALDQARQCVPQVAVVDINLPDGNGIQLMKLLHALRPQSPVPVVLMTASKTIGLRELAIEQGAIHFIEKPFRSGDLLQVLDSINDASVINCSSVVQV